MRVTLFIVLLATGVAAFLLISRYEHVSWFSRDPVPGEVYQNIETGQRIVIDDVGSGGEIVARYRQHNADLTESDLSDRGVVSALIVPLSNEADSLRDSFSYLGEETVTTEPGEVYIFDGEWHGEVPVTVAYVHSVAWLRAKFELIAPAP